MAKKTKDIEFRVKVINESGDVVEKTVKNINDLEEALKGTQDALKNADIGSAKWKELNSAVEQNAKALGKASSAGKGLGDQFSAIPGPIGQVAQGVKGLGTAFKALIANPVGLILAAIAAALTTLYKAFTSTKEGAEKMEQVFAGVGAAIDVLRDRVLKVGGAIIKFFKGDFAGAAEDVKGAFTGIGEEIAGEFNQAMALKKELQAIDDATRELNNSRAEQNKLIAEAKLKINDENLSYEDRLSALEEVREAEIKLAKQEEELALRRYEAIKAQNALSDSSAEALQEEADAYAALQNAQLASFQKQKELFDQEKALRDKAKAEREAAAKAKQAIDDQIRKAEQENLLASIEDEEERARKAAEIQLSEQMLAIDRLEASTEQKNKLREEAEEKYQLAVKAINDKAEADRQKKEEEAKKAKEEADKEELAKAQEKADLLKTIREATATTEEEERQLEIEKIQEYYNKLIEEAEAFGLDTTALTEARNNAVAAKNKEHREKDVADEIAAERQKLEAKADITKQSLETVASLVTAFAADNEKAQKRAFNVQKGVNIATATIDTYLAATKVLSAASANPATILFPGYPALQAGLIIAAGLANVATIAKQQFQPAGGGGGGDAGGGGGGPRPSKFANGGLLEGPSHSQGGIKTNLGELEGGEYVVNKESTKKNFELLEKINSMKVSPINMFDHERLKAVTGILREHDKGIMSGSKETPVMKTYVVASEVSSQQEADKRISDLARL